MKSLINAAFMRKSLIVVSLVIMMSLGGIYGCDIPSAPAKVDQQSEARKKIKNVNSLMGKQSATALAFSMDRYLLNERNVRFNDPNKMSYLYVFTPDGRTIQFTIMGKVASTSKRLSTPVQTYRIDRGANNGTTLGPAPDDMGVYGSSSGSAKCGMTTLGSLIEFGGFGFYIYSEVPLIFRGMDHPMIEFDIKVTDAEKASLLKELKEVQRKAHR